MTKPKLVFASTIRVDEFSDEVSELLRYIASVLKESEETEDEWLSFTFVSDESRLADFLFKEAELIHLRECTGISTLIMRDLICDVASEIHRQKELPTIN